MSEINLHTIASKMITELLSRAEADKLRAQGVKLLYDALVTEATNNVQGQKEDATTEDTKPGV